jgi:predicted ester cyclase
MDFLTIIDGKVTEEWLTADIMGLMQQLGDTCTIYCWY